MFSKYFIWEENILSHVHLRDSEYNRHITVWFDTFFPSYLLLAL